MLDIEDVKSRQSVFGRVDDDVSERVSGGSLIRFGSPCV